MHVGRIYVVGLLAFGIAAGLGIATTPALRALPVPAFAWPLLVSLIVDVALLPLVREERVQPLTMEQRAVGVIGSALIIIAITALIP